MPATSDAHTSLLEYHIPVILWSENRSNENLLEEPFDRWRCQMALILALAIFDKAIERLPCAQDIESLRFHRQHTAHVLRIRPGAREVPIHRQAKRGTSLISAVKILTAAALTGRLKELGHRAGYVEGLILTRLSERIWKHPRQ
ncbi:hypothetical protein AC579_5991 [Pseudocercospora musae]|uniref:Uncharacterized protein n=1 Tax=Pseudocercospora musae TaxID=113226 RepID=A0A139I4D8_9PEZI|nr:hypothetical protein AC579_5991 [Pseudocercospora musae]